MSFSANNFASSICFRYSSAFCELVSSTRYKLSISRQYHSSNSDETGLITDWYSIARAAQKSHHEGYVGEQYYVNLETELPVPEDQYEAEFHKVIKNFMDIYLSLIHI